jgi:glycosyltransferase involved in cell wall biosynthesis
MRQNPLLSLVVTSYTTERLSDIFELLESIKNQTYKNIEVIFVAEHSKELYDRVKTYAEEKGVPNMVAVFRPERLGICASRNLGVKQARGSIITFTDDDALPYPDWAEEIIKTFDGDDIIGVTGPALPLWEKGPISWFPEEFYWMLGCTAWLESDKKQTIRGAFGVNMSFKKEAFGSCRFSENLGISQGAHKAGKVGLLVDDLEFSLHLGRDTKKLIIYNPKVRVQHKVYGYRLTPLFIRRQAYWQGYSKAILKKLYGKGDRNENIMGTEYRMLKRVVFKLLPSTLIGFSRHPSIAAKRLRLTVSVLFHVGLGYFSAALPALGTITRKVYGSS